MLYVQRPGEIMAIITGFLDFVKGYWTDRTQSSTSVQ
jgi:hypothetical protein